METKIINQLQQYVPTLLMKLVTPEIPKIDFQKKRKKIVIQISNTFFIFFIYDTRKVRFFIVNVKKKSCNIFKYCQFASESFFFKSSWSKLLPIEGFTNHRYSVIDIFMMAIDIQS